MEEAGSSSVVTRARTGPRASTRATSLRCAGKLAGRRTAIGIVGAIALAAALTGCGAATGVSGDRPSADELEATHALGTLVTEAVSGDGAAREAVAFRDWRILNQPTTACMDRAGLRWRPEYVPLWQGYQSAGVVSEWLAPLHLRLASQSLASRVAAAQAASAPAKRTDESYRRALGKCMRNPLDGAALPETAGSQMALGHIPHQELADSLSAAYTRLLTEVESQLGPIKEYADCMADQGVDVTGGTAGGFSALYIRLTSQAPPVEDRPLPDKSVSPAWTTYLAQENRALDADEACRAMKYHEGMAILAPRLEQFVNDHQSDIDTLNADWAAVVKQADEDGLRAYTD